MGCVEPNRFSTRELSATSVWLLVKSVRSMVRDFQLVGVANLGDFCSQELRAFRRMVGKSTLHKPHPKRVPLSLSFLEGFDAQSCA